ncbi:hypothetical protein [uncultured Mediterranean phage uvMED]|nr:hypothetical protein [uncultured Mediterranean phage uvMED]
MNEILNEKKQEESRKIQEATDAFLRNGGVIQKLPPVMSFGPDLTLHQVEREGETEYEKVINKATQTAERKHPWRTFRSVV